MTDERHVYVLRVKREKRDYELNCETDSPLGELFDVMNEMQSIIVKKIQEAQLSQPKDSGAEETIEVL